MKMKTLLIGGATFAVAGALFAGVSYAAQNDSTAPAPSEPVAASTPSPTPTLLTEPTPTPTPTPTETATPTPEPTTEPAPAPAPTQQAAPPVAPAPAAHDWPKFVPVSPQPPTPAGMEGYQATADGTWFIGCGQDDNSCSWTAGPGPAPTAP